MPARLEFSREDLARFCEKQGIRRLALFDLFMKGSAGPESDVDLLVDFEPNRLPGFLRLAELEAELSSLFGGRVVDLRTAADLSRYFRDEAMRTAEVQYAR